MVASHAVSQNLGFLAYKLELAQRGVSGRYRNEWRQWFSCTDSCWVDGPVMG